MEDAFTRRQGLFGQHDEMLGGIHDMVGLNTIYSLQLHVYVHYASWF